MNEDKIIQKLIELDEKIDKLPLQEYVDARFDDVMSTLDAHTKMLERLDQERLFTIERVKRIEDDVQQLKTQLKLA
ncbi:hypothetical protein KKF05_04530 [Patescibacteria group bacterium]|nr:hypothetical protein [Patescibacteria group bacterium]MBU1916022.1 hypothetical protein [Patescibacteria group bacterium]